MVQRQEQRLGVTREQEAEERHRREHKRDQHPEWRREQRRYRERSNHTPTGDQAIVQSPDRQQKISLLALVGVIAIRTTMQRTKPVIQRPRLPPGIKDSRSATLRPSQPQ